MLKSQFINIIKQPFHLESSQIAELEMIVNEYPFFESAHLLYTKSLHKHNAINYSKQLRKTAIVANSRAVLYQLLHEEPQETLIKPQLPLTNVKEAIQPIVDIKIEASKVEDIKVEESKVEDMTKVVNPVSITDNEIKIVYVNTVSKPIELTPEKKMESVNKELEIIQTIENETEVPENDFHKQKLNKIIGDEIKRSVIQSYVETDIIKTPELNKEEATEPGTFTEWLKTIQKESHTFQKPEPKKEDPKSKKSDEIFENKASVDKKPAVFEQRKQLIDKIIESDPGRIKLGSTKFFTPATDAKQSLLENEHLVTETLAKIYALQGNISKAIRAYEILSLKFPQKSVYFASLIEKLKNKN